jgi:hypothetical protein
MLDVRDAIALGTATIGRIGAIVVDRALNKEGDPMSRSRFHMSRTELAIVVLMLGSLTWVLWRAVPRGRAGNPIPAVPPDESRRQHFKSGLSIVLPPDWVGSSTGGLLITPRDPRP